jgi:hypothetical protein
MMIDRQAAQTGIGSPFGWPAGRLSAGIVTDDLVAKIMRQMAGLDPRQPIVPADPSHARYTPPDPAND